MLRKAIRHLWILGTLLLIPAVAGAGANSWTGGGAAGTVDVAPGFVSADPFDPEVVYATFGPVLHRSPDGGRTWVRVREFDNVTALLVHPASPSTIYVAGTLDGGIGIHVSRDGGETWTTIGFGDFYSLAASPTDPNTIFAGAWNHVFKTTDGGLSWHSADLVGTIESLVIHPRDESIAYAAGTGSDYLGEYPGSMSRSTDGGLVFSDTGFEPVDSVFAVAVDPFSTSTVYMSIGPYEWGRVSNPIPDVLRSDDGGASWTSASRGLPSVIARTLVADPRVPGTLYAGTDVGIYRTRDGGLSWAPLGHLLGTKITSLAISRDGRRLHAATAQGVHDLELAIGPLDVATGASGASRFLVFDGDRLSVGAVDASGSWSGLSPEGASATWTPVAIADAGGDRARVLWQNGDGRAALELVGPSGRQSAVVFPARPDWIARDLSARADGTAHVLWTAQDGRMSVGRVSPSGVSVEGPVSDAVRGWSAIAVADGAAETWVLWRSADGRAALSVHRDDGAMTRSYVIGAFLDWSAGDLAIAADGRPRLLRTSPSGLASVVTIDEAGRPIVGARYTLPGFTPRRIAAGDDGLTRLLFSSEDGQGQVLLLGGDNHLLSKKAFHPLSGVVVTTAAELEAAMTPANVGKQILVRAGEYEIAHALTVPDRATVVGEGEMLFDGSGLPAGMAAAGRTLLRSAADLDGDVLTLGNGSALRGLVIEDAEGRSTGNPVAVVSRSAGDSVSARIDACEIVNPNPSGIAPSGPTGRALVVVNRNPNLAFDPPAHVGAALDVRMTSSIVRSPAGAIGVFAINFASKATINLDLTGDVIGGGLTCSGGVSRPEAVTGAAIEVRSRRNLYRSDSADPTPLGWNLSGGSTAPIPNIVSEASTSNSLRVHSTDDRIEGFLFGISAVGGQRVVATSQPISFNTLELNLQGTRLQSPVADLSLFGAVSFEPGVSPGDGNVLRLNMRQAAGSGPRENAYANSSEGLGEGNRLEVTGSPNAFDHTNPGIDPRPSDEFFESQ